MQSVGLAEIERAKADGRWDAAYQSQALATIPSDVAVALEHDLVAKAAFEKLSKSDQYTTYLPVLKAISLQTRALHVQKMLQRLHDTYQ